MNIAKCSSGISEKDDGAFKWAPKFKNYPHFDKPIIQEKVLEVSSMVTDKALVKAHTFFPFLCYKVTTKKFSSDNKKVRPILYAAHKDSHIYSYYRHLLAKPYENILKKRGLNECVIAYRRVKNEEGGGDNGKCNIDFANEAFEEIKKHNECIAIALDITSFFESLSHDQILQKWCEVLEEDRLPDDHYQIYKNITNYKMVDLDECYERLKWMSVKIVNGQTKKEYAFPRKKQPKQLCSYPEFRTRIAGYKNKYNSLIKKNPNLHNSCGIPQGSPISDVIANIYMLDFDLEMKELADKKGGYYRRYSDDILLVIPGNTNNIQEIIKLINHYIINQKLALNKSKTIITKAYKSDNNQALESFNEEGTKLSKPFFEYLGFSFDGKKKLFRDSSLTRFYKKITNAIKQQHIFAKNKASVENKQDSNVCINQSIIFKKFSSSRKEMRNFITYANRAINIMKDPALKKQIRNYKKFIRKKIKQMEDSLSS